MSRVEVEIPKNVRVRTMEFTQICRDLAKVMGHQVYSVEEVEKKLMLLDGIIGTIPGSYAFIDYVREELLADIRFLPEQLYIDLSIPGDSGIGVFYKENTPKAELLQIFRWQPMRIKIAEMTGRPPEAERLRVRLEEWKTAYENFYNRVPCEEDLDGEHSQPRVSEPSSQ